MVDLVQIPCGKMQLSPKLELYRANQDQIRNQRTRLRRNALFLVKKRAGAGCKVVPDFLVLVYYRLLINNPVGMKVDYVYNDECIPLKAILISSKFLAKVKS